LSSTNPVTDGEYGGNVATNSKVIAVAAIGENAVYLYEMNTKQNFPLLKRLTEGKGRFEISLY
jgi:hypothetical protein